MVMGKTIEEMTPEEIKKMIEDDDKKFKKLNAKLEGMLK